MLVGLRRPGIQAGQPLRVAQRGGRVPHLEGEGPRIPTHRQRSRLGPLLTAGWNLLLIPAALDLWRRHSNRCPGLSLVYTVVGVLSPAFWAFGGVTRITPELEITYLSLSAIWW